MFPASQDVLDRRVSGGITSVDFLWREDPLSEAERCVRSGGEATRCFAFSSVMTHSASGRDTSGDLSRPACWDGFASSESGEDGGGSAPPAPPRGACPQNPLGLPDGFWPVVVPEPDSELVREPRGELRVYQVVAIVNEASLCRAALAEVAGACASVEASDLTPFFEPFIIGENVHLMPLAWDFRVLVVAPDSCYAVDVFPDPELPIEDWFTANLRLGLRFGTSSLPADDPGRCPQ